MSDSTNGGIEEKIKRIKSPIARKIAEEFLKNEKLLEEMEELMSLSLPTFRIISIPEASKGQGNSLSSNQYYIFMIYPINPGIDQKELLSFINQNWNLVEPVKLYLTGGKRRYGKKTTAEKPRDLREIKDFLIKRVLKKKEIKPSINKKVERFITEALKIPPFPMIPGAYLMDSLFFKHILGNEKMSEMLQRKAENLMKRYMEKNTFKVDFGEKGGLVGIDFPIIFSPIQILRAFLREKEKQIEFEEAKKALEKLEKRARRTGKKRGRPIKLPPEILSLWNELREDIENSYGKRDREIFEQVMIKQNLTGKEAAEKYQCSEKTIRRKIKRIKDSLLEVGERKSTAEIQRIFAEEQEKYEINIELEGLHTTSKA